MTAAERLPEPRYDAASLAFKPWTLQEMLAANQADLEAFLTHIYRAIASAAPLKVCHAVPAADPGASTPPTACVTTYGLTSPVHLRLRWFDILEPQDKVNVLSYFETLCVDTNAANVLINSSLTILFIRMLRNARAPTLRIRLASVLGKFSCLFNTHRQRSR